MSDNNDNPGSRKPPGSNPTAQEWREQNGKEKMSPEQIQLRRQCGHDRRLFNDKMKLIVPLLILIISYLYTRSIIKTILIGVGVFIFAWVYLVVSIFSVM